MTQMPHSASAPGRGPDYGIDAPDVIRNLLLCAAAGLLLWGSVALHWWSGAIAIPGTGVRILVGAAKRVPKGHAVGIDIWQAEDLTGNSPDATMENARREGVADRVSVKTADMRALPFPDGTFDVIVSCAAIHNISKAADRAQAIREIARVLTPGGRVAIMDIRHIGDYAATLADHGCADSRRVGARWKAVLTTLVTWGSLRPGTLVARKG